MSGKMNGKTVIITLSVAPVFVKSENQTLPKRYAITVAILKTANKTEVFLPKFKKCKKT